VQWTRTASLCSPLTPTVSCASVETSVAHPAPSPSGQVPRASTQRPGPTSHPSAHSVSSKASVAPGFDRTVPHHFVPGHLVLAHLARTRPCVFRPPSRSPVPVVTTHIRAALLRPCQRPGVLKCPASELITSRARHRRHHSLRTPPGLTWHVYGVGHTQAPLQRPPAQLTRRAVDSHSFAVLATDAHG